MIKSYSGIINYMHISINQTAGIKKSLNNFGYSRIYHELTRTITNFGITVHSNNSGCPIQVYIGDRPVNNSHHSHQFKVYFIDNESTLMLQENVDGLAEADEIWTGNFYARDACIASGLDPNKVFVYEHGLISDIYSRKLRGQNHQIKFLHVDSGSQRKGAQYAVLAFNAIRSIYGDQVALTLKFTDKQSNKYISIDNVNKYIEECPELGPGISSITGNFTPEDLVLFEQQHDVMVYPSEGEGFGIIPLEALATGMPTICTKEWSSYSEFFKNHAIEARMGRNGIQWNFKFGGDVVVPRVSSIIEKMSEVIENIEEVSRYYYDQSPAVIEKYDWQKITNSFMESFIDRVGKDKFEMAR